jgi:hypothetical protein
MGCRSSLLHQRGVLLRHLVHLRDRVADLFDSLALLIRCRSYLACLAAAPATAACASVCATNCSSEV